MKHTPGPWTVTVEYEAGSDPSDGHAQDTAYYLDAGGVGISEDEAHANARLMECAPELLQQLKVCTALLKHYAPDKSKELVTECEALIQRAKGRKQ